MTKIAIIGAGPSGLLLSLYLVQHSAQFRHQVSLTLFERENNHDFQDRSNPDRSYTIDITGHGLKAVRSIGSDLESRFDKELIPFRGVHAYVINKTLPYLEKGWTGSRGDICSCLLHELQNKLESSSGLVEVEVNWNSRVSEVNPQSGEVTWNNLSDDEGKEHKNQFDLIVGADGGGSMLRNCLEGEKLLETRKSAIPNYSRILHLDNNSAEAVLEPSLLHGFSLKPWAVGGAILDVVSQAKEVDQSSTAKKFFVQMGYSDDLPYADVEAAENTLQQINLRQHGAAHKTNKAAVTLRHYVSDSELDSFASRPVYHTGKTVRCSTLAVEKCVLIGDAATAFPPVGQGVNAALEGAATLGKILADEFAKPHAPTNISECMQSYSAEWLPQANACADIANTVVYGSVMNRTKLILQGALGKLTGIDIAAAQLAKHSKYSYVEALQKSQFRNRLALAAVVGFAALLFVVIT